MTYLKTYFLNTCAVVMKFGFMFLDMFLCFYDSADLIWGLVSFVRILFRNTFHSVSNRSEHLLHTNIYYTTPFQVNWTSTAPTQPRPHPVLIPFLSCFHPVLGSRTIKCGNPCSHPLQFHNKTPGSFTLTLVVNYIDL